MAAKPKQIAAIAASTENTEHVGAAMAAKPKQIVAIAAPTENTEHVGAAMAANPKTDCSYSCSY